PPAPSGREKRARPPQAETLMASSATAAAARRRAFMRASTRMPPPRCAAASAVQPAEREFGDVIGELAREGTRVGGRPQELQRRRHRKAIEQGLAHDAEGAALDGAPAEA